MSYSIRYGPQKQKTVKHDGMQWTYTLGIIFVCAALAAALLWPEVREGVAAVLFPWAGEPTVEAFSSMVASVEDGVSVGDAFLAFCREVIENAGPFT